jgi:hypothetical protein
MGNRVEPVISGLFHRRCGIPESALSRTRTCGSDVVGVHDVLQAKMPGLGVGVGVGGGLLAPILFGGELQAILCGPGVSGGEEWVGPWVSGDQHVSASPLRLTDSSSRPAVLGNHQLLPTMHQV